MLFNSFTYLLFLPVVVALYWLGPKWLRLNLLLVASYVFYMSWIPAYGLLILALTVCNYFIGIAIDRFDNHKKRVLVGGLIFNLGCLCFYKYANFLLESFFGFWSCLKTWLSVPVVLNPITLNILLPLGISFFTFEFIHYIVDIYRGSKPISNFRNFALFAAFFPSQIAGPIKRYQDFMQQLSGDDAFRADYFHRGMALVLQGLFKKIALGDNIGRIVNAGFANPQGLGTLDAWIVVPAFTLQIFFDFSGYTDIGRGSALLLGYKVPENFNWPFLSSNLSDFWRRWHMSLTSWLRDYLFIPLGGSRVGPWRQRFNLMLTMVLGGLWHGAAWHYVIWGAFHGLGLVITKDWQEFVGRTPVLNKLRPSAAWHGAGVFTTWIFLTFAGLLFRSDDIPHALEMASRLFVLAPSTQIVSMVLTSTLMVSMPAYLTCLWLSSKARPIVNPRSTPGAAPDTVREASLWAPIRSWYANSLPAQVALYTTCSLVILGLAPGQVTPFIYFQF